MYVPAYSIMPLLEEGTRLDTVESFQQIKLRYAGVVGNMHAGFSKTFIHAVVLVEWHIPIACP